MLSLIPLLLLKAQPGMMLHNLDPRMKEKMESFEKARLIEVMKLDDEKLVKLLKLRQDCGGKIMEKQIRRNVLIDSLIKMLNPKSENSVNDADCKGISDELMKIDEELSKQRVEYDADLQKILSPKEIAKLFVFDRFFKDDLKNIIREGRKDGEHRGGRPEGDRMRKMKQRNHSDDSCNECEPEGDRHSPQDDPEN